MLAFEFDHYKISPFSFEKFLPLSDTMIKFVISSKENGEQIKSNLRNSIYCKIRLVTNMVQDELRNKSTGIIHNELIMQWED